MTTPRDPWGIPLTGRDPDWTADLDLSPDATLRVWQRLAAELRNRTNGDDSEPA